MIKINYQQTRFFTSVPSVQYLPIDTGVEIAFVGYSNVGKSSMLNVLTNQKKLARTSKVPGCTQMINLFEVAKGKRLVDLPGYGYAKISKILQKKWQKNLAIYIEKRLSLKGLVLLMDIRYPLKELDQKIVQNTVNNNISMLILLNKSDLLSKEKRNFQLNLVRKTVVKYNTDIQIEIFSSFKKYGVDKLRHKLNNWYNNAF